MFKQIFHIALAALTVFGAIGPAPLLSGVAHAASPNTLSYQGRLKDDDGVVVADGDYDFTFTLWTAVSGGTADWTEDQTLTVTDGYFSAQLGSVDAFLNGAGQETDFTVPLWLEVEVEAETLDPRVAVNSVAYSFSSRSIESFASEAAAEADAANFGGRMYYNTTDGNLYVYDSVATDWVDTTSGTGLDDLDEAYNNFGATAATVTVDNAQGQGNLTFRMNGADLVMTDSLAETFVTFGDDGTTVFAKGMTANGTVTLGDNGDTVAVNSSDWDITTAGNMTGIGSINADGAVVFTSTLAVTGDTTLTGDLAVNGDDITSDGDLTLTVTGGQLLLADTNVINLGGITGTAYHAISNAGGAADSVNVAADNDLYIQDDLEVDGTSVFDGNTDLNGTVTINAVTTFNASPVFNSTLTADGAIEANGGITTQDGTALTLNSGDVDAINIGSDTDAESINIGTGAATKTITIGNGSGATVLNIDTGTGGVDIDLLGAMSVDGELLVVGGAADGNTATGDADLYVVGDFEADGIVDLDGSFDFDGTTFDADGSGLVSFTSTGASVTLAASDTGNVGDDNVVLTAGDAAPNAAENGNDVAFEAEGSILGEATQSIILDSGGSALLRADTGDLDLTATSSADTGDVIVTAGNAAPDAGENGNDIAMQAEDDVLVEATDDFDVDAADMIVLASGAITLDSGAASNFTTSAGALTLNGNGGVNVVGNAAEIDLTTTGAVDVNSGAGTWDASTLSLDSTDTTNLTMTANDAGEKTLSVAATNLGAGAGRVNINSDGTISIDAVTASNFTVTGAADLTLRTTAGSAILMGGEAAADAVRIFADNAAGGIDMDAGTAGVDVDSTGVMSFDGELVAIGGAADGNTATGDADLYVVGDFEADGIADFDGSFDFDGTTFDADGSGLVSLTSTAASLTLAASDAGNVGDDNIVLSAGNAAPDAGENGNDVVVEAEDAFLVETTGNVDIDAGQALTLDSTGGALSINSSGAAINIGNNADAQAINVGTGPAARTITVGNGTDATALNFDTGTGGFDVDLLGVMSLDGELVAIGGAADGDLATGDADLYVVGDFEVDGSTRYDGAVSFNSDIDVTLTGTENVVISNTTGDASVDVLAIQITNTDTTAAVQRGLVLTNQSNAAVTVTENLIALDNLDGDTLADGIVVAATGVITDAIDAQATNIVNAINVGDNVVLGTAASINFTEFDVSNTSGSVTIDDDANAGQVSVDGTVLDINSLGFVAAGQVLTGAATALTLTGGDNGTDAGEDVVIDGENWNVNASGLIDTNGGLTVSAGDIALTDSSGTTWSITNTGVAQFGASVTIAGAADGTDALTLTAGDILVTNGDFTMSGGDFDVTLDSADSATVTNATATSASAAFVVNQTTDASNTGNSVGLGVNATFTEYADDGLADNRQGIVVNVTSSDVDGGVAADTIAGLRVQNLAGANQANGNEFAIRLGTGWDVDLSLGNSETISNQADDLVVFGSAGGINNTSISFDLDGSSVTNVPSIISGGSDLLTVFDGLSVGIDGETTENLTAAFAFGGGNDLYVEDQLGVNGNIFTDGQLVLQGTGDGNDSIVVTTGDVLVSDGDFDLSGGDFNVTLDAADASSFLSTASTVAGTIFNFAATTDASHAGNVTGAGVSLTLTDYAPEDNFADSRDGFAIGVTNNNVDTSGVDDTIAGLRVKGLGGANQADGNEYAIAIGTSWDADLQLGNAETVSNQTDDLVVLSGTGGTNNTSITFDLDGTSVTNVPAIVSGGSDLVTVFDSLSIGIDGETTENISVTGFAIGAGDDLYVQDDVGINGDTYLDGILSYGNETALTLNSTTPSVSGGSHFFFNNNAGTLVSNFTNGQIGQLIFVRVVDAGNTDIDCTASSINCGTTDITTLAAGDFLTFFLDGVNTWQLVSYMDDGDNHDAGNGFDLAEWFPASEELSAGDVVSIDPSGIETVRKSQAAYESSVVGIVSTEPGLTLGEPASVFASQIALAGRVPVNVSNENGAIVPGDYLTTSSTPGVAMKATEAGPVIGIAMDSFDGASGQVVVKIANFWYVPPTTEASSLQGSDGSALSAGVLSAESFVVAGNAVFEGSVTVEGHLYGGADMAGRARINTGDTRVHVPFTEEYAAQPIVTATLRTATDIPGYWWVEGESTTGFDLVLDGTLAYPVEFNWIALGVEAGRVNVSDGSSQEINVYVVDGGAAPEMPEVVEVVEVIEVVGVTEEPVIAEPVPEPVVEEAPVVAEEPAPVVADEPVVVEKPVAEPASEPVVVEEPAAEIIP